MARASSEPYDYSSGMDVGRILYDLTPMALIWDTKDDPIPLGEAYRRARDRGFDVRERGDEE